MKRILLAGLMAAMLVLAACGKQDAQVAGGHGAHEEEHSEGHSGEQAKEESPKTNAIWKWSSETPKSNEELTITTQIQTLDGKDVEQFDINHEKKLHLIIVSKDLSYFDHLHPEYKGKGAFEVKTTFPAGGEYKLIADYIPTGDTATTQSEWIKVSGSSAEAAPIRPSETHSVVVDGVEVTLENDHPHAGEEFELDFKLADSSNKQPITDLEPYLGAVGHVVILSEDTERYLHVHPMDEQASGPDAKFMTTFPQAGIYKIWGQFQRNGKTFVSSFVVEVE
jgi:Cu+-exporting ATPase